MTVMLTFLETSNVWVHINTHTHFINKSVVYNVVHRSIICLLTRVTFKSTEAVVIMQDNNTRDGGNFWCFLWIGK